MRFLRFRRTCLLTAALVGMIGLCLALPSSAQTPVRRLSSNVLPGLDQLAPSAVSPSTPMTLGIALSHPDPAGESALYQSLYDPRSASYRHFLSPATFNQRYGVPAAVMDRTVSWLKTGGLAVATVGSPGYVLATGRVDQIEALFATTIKGFKSGTTSFIANTVPPAVPTDLPILSVVGLNTLQKFSATPRSSAKKSLLSALPGLPNVLATTPQSLWSVYEQPDAFRGAGQKVAIFGSGASAGAISDLALFETKNHLPAVPVSVHNVGPGPFTDTSGAVEWNIDTQAAAGMAPDLSGLTLYFGANLVDATVEAMFESWANDPDGPAQANASFGECERTPLDPLFLTLPGDVSQDPTATFGLALGNNLQPVADQTLRQAAIEGRTLFSSTGDTGSSCPVLILPGIGPGNGLLNQVVPLTNYPASSPYAVGVGGTVLYTKGTTPDARFAEYAWTFGGGGDSLLIDAPAYQAGTSGLFLPCVATVDGQLTNLGKPCRGIPDVAAQSGDALTNGYAIVSAGADSQGGGTSLSSPLWAGMWARVNQSAGGSGYGFANETIYRLGRTPATLARDFFDITVGSNGIYAAVPGWDYVSGFGSPRLSTLIADAH
jgi:pseudomonalisin